MAVGFYLFIRVGGCFFFFSFLFVGQLTQLPYKTNREMKNERKNRERGKGKGEERERESTSEVVVVLLAAAACC